MSKHYFAAHPWREAPVAHAPLLRFGRAGPVYGDVYPLALDTAECAVTKENVAKGYRPPLPRLGSMQIRCRHADAPLPTKLGPARAELDAAIASRPPPLVEPTQPADAVAALEALPKAAASNAVLFMNRLAQPPRTVPLASLTFIPRGIQSGNIFYALARSRVPRLRALWLLRAHFARAQATDPLRSLDLTKKLALYIKSFFSEPGGEVAKDISLPLKSNSLLSENAAPQATGRGSVDASPHATEMWAYTVDLALALHAEVGMLSLDYWLRSLNQIWSTVLASEAALSEAAKAFCDRPGTLAGAVAPDKIEYLLPPGGSMSVTFAAAYSLISVFLPEFVAQSHLAQLLLQTTLKGMADLARAAPTPHSPITAARAVVHTLVLRASRLFVYAPAPLLDASLLGSDPPAAQSTHGFLSLTAAYAPVANARATLFGKPEGTQPLTKSVPPPPTLAQILTSQSRRIDDAVLAWGKSRALPDAVGILVRWLVECKTPAQSTEDTLRARCISVAGALASFVRARDVRSKHLHVALLESLHAVGRPLFDSRSTAPLHRLLVLYGVLASRGLFDYAALDRACTAQQLSRDSPRWDSWPADLLMAFPLDADPIAAANRERRAKLLSLTVRKNEARRLAAAPSALVASLVAGLAPDDNLVPVVVHELVEAPTAEVVSTLARAAALPAISSPMPDRSAAPGPWLEAGFVRVWIKALMRAFGVERCSSSSSRDPLPCVGPNPELVAALAMASRGKVEAALTGVDPSAAVASVVEAMAEGSRACLGLCCGVLGGLAEEAGTEGVAGAFSAAMANLAPGRGPQLKDGVYLAAGLGLASLVHAVSVSDAPALSLRDSKLDIDEPVLAVLLGAVPRTELAALVKGVPRLGEVLDVPLVRDAFWSASETDVDRTEFMEAAIGDGSGVELLAKLAGQSAATAAELVAARADPLGLWSSEAMVAAVAQVADSSALDQVLDALAVSVLSRVMAVGGSGVDALDFRALAEAAASGGGGEEADASRALLASIAVPRARLSPDAALAGLSALLGVGAPRLARIEQAVLLDAIAAYVHSVVLDAAAVAKSPTRAVEAWMDRVAKLPSVADVAVAGPRALTAALATITLQRM
ncbi:uncharacterized protein AMSG_01247 [Thecamonas trahens ATCC 50062]|uniref:Uncharacterized protein n=1 Tax=Thecamonas trahens ATCC 50062 TaxID=461836 RepID=A0A0L0DMI8_THETB|nr:hypothetical protein AMSG_01247 [Thecamonas trahens ATCC 50062]KNC53534.1 hypothetical protein AMSG_01247 [Thecamonas trahens ATCC 50062]|eukprot:XP_013761855.1 hypothetical protein AMSG_01247 [Thecamonas trahens ATCC 50062]